MRLRHAIATCAVGALSLSVGAATSSAAAFPVTGYVVAGDPAAAAAISRLHGSITDVGVDGATLDAAGNVTVADSARALLRAAHAQGLTGSLLLSNWSDAHGDFWGPIATAVLSDPGARSRVVGSLRDDVTAAGWDGVTVDIEAVPVGNGPGLSAFVAELKVALPATTVDIDLPAGEPGDDLLEPFDLPTLAAGVDHLTLMAYDQHYIGGSPGPIGGYPWFTHVIQNTAARVPLSHVRVGIAAYGYWWRPGHPTVSLSTRRARQLAGGRAHWSARQREWRASVPRSRGGGTVWWSGERSIRTRLAYARHVGAGGAAIWDLVSASGLPPLR